MALCVSILLQMNIESDLISVAQKISYSISYSYWLHPYCPDMFVDNSNSFPYCPSQQLMLSHVILTREILLS